MSDLIELLRDLDLDAGDGLGPALPCESDALLVAARSVLRREDLSPGAIRFLDSLAGPAAGSANAVDAAFLRRGTVGGCRPHLRAPLTVRLGGLAKTVMGDARRLGYAALVLTLVTFSPALPALAWQGHQAPGTLRMTCPPMGAQAPAAAASRPGLSQVTFAVEVHTGAAHPRLLFDRGCFQVWLPLPAGDGGPNLATGVASTFFIPVSHVLALDADPGGTGMLIWGIHPYPP